MSDRPDREGVAGPEQVLSELLLAELENARALLLRAVNSMSDGFVLFDADDRIVMCNQIYASMLDGFTPAENLVGMHVEQIIRAQVDRGQPLPEEYHGDLERWVAERVEMHRRADGQPHVQRLSDGRWVQSIRHRTPDGGIVVLRSDITALKESEERAQMMAHYDALTGLPNRRLLQERMREALSRAKRTSRMIAVMVIDLDDFKPVNDTHGHTAGDHVLRLIADRLKGCLRITDTVARFGGDEFVVVIDAFDDARDADSVAAKILDAVARPIQAASAAAPDVRVDCSIGISLYPRDSSDPETLIKLADAAMYQAKQGGRGRFAHAAPRS